jgi:hypothetical protein
VTPSSSLQLSAPTSTDAWAYLKGYQRKKRSLDPDTGFGDLDLKSVPQPIHKVFMEFADIFHKLCMRVAYAPKGL